MTDPPAVRFEAAVRRFREVSALDGLTMDVPAGSVFGLVGDNGAGKTTAIHALLGLLPLERGRVSAFGMDPAARGTELRRVTGFFPERDQPYGWMKLSTLLQMARHAFPRWDTDREAEWLDRFELDPCKRVKEMSKGMVAKAKLLVVLGRRVRLAVLDEPINGLDPTGREALDEGIRELAAGGSTVLLSSHSLEELSRVATHLGVMAAGRCVHAGPMEDLWERWGLIEDPGGGPETLPGVEVLGSAVGRGGGRRWLVADRHAAALEALGEEGPGRTLRAPTLAECFSLLRTRAAVSRKGAALAA